MSKKVLLIGDNLPTQINGVVTTYKNLEPYAIRDGYSFYYIHPGLYRHVSCPIYNEVKIAYPKNIEQTIQKICPDHIHISTEGPIGLFARKYLSKYNYCYNTAYHTKFPEGLKKLLYVPETLSWNYLRWFHDHSGKVLTTTNTMVAQLKQHGLTGEIIPWTRGVDRTVFNDSYRKPKTNNKIKLVCVSRVSREKNLEDFCRLQYPNSEKIMVGDGPYRSYLEKKYPDVRFVGFKTGRELAEYYADADVFVFPSRWETFGIVMIEAMACGTPVAAYPDQGPIDVVDPYKTGCLSESLTDAIDMCLLLDRNRVKLYSQRWSWEQAWQIFKDNLV